MFLLHPALFSNQQFKKQIFKTNNMKLKSFYFLILILCSMAVSSCYYDKADLLYGTHAPCDTLTTVSYSLDVVPLLQQYCYGCHGGTNPDGGVAMGTYSTDKVIALNGKLYGTINHANGFSPMPEGEAKLSDCKIALIKKWIDASSPNN
jgi:hypothetical protein